MHKRKLKSLENANWFKLNRILKQRKMLTFICMLSTHVYILKVEHTKDTDKSHNFFVKLECSCNSVHIIYFVGLFAVTTEKNLLVRE